MFILFQLYVSIDSWSSSLILLVVLHCCWCYFVLFPHFEYHYIDCTNKWCCVHTLTVLIALGIMKQLSNLYIYSKCIVNLSNAFQCRLLDWIQDCELFANINTTLQLWTWHRLVFMCVNRSMCWWLGLLASTSLRSCYSSCYQLHIWLSTHHTSVRTLFYLLILMFEKNK